MDRIEPLVLGIYATGGRPRYPSPAIRLGRESLDKKMKVSNKGFLAVGAQARLSLNRDARQGE